MPVERLAEYAREKTRCRGVRLAGTHDDRRQANADAIKEAAARVVGKQQLVDRLLRAIAGERGVEPLVTDSFRERRAEHRDRGGEYDTWSIGRLLAGMPDRLE